jgi:hypothetical protein
VSGFEKLDTKVGGLADRFTGLQVNNQERNANLTDYLQMLTARLRASTEYPPPLSPPTTRPQQQVQSPRRGGENRPPPSPADAARRHRMVP